MNRFRCVTVVCASLALCNAPLTHSAEPQPTSGELAVKGVSEVASPCDVNKQRMSKVGGGALGAVIGYGLCRLVTEVVDKDSSTSSKNKKAAVCAVVGGIAGYSWAADSGRRQCELYRIAQQSQVEASFQEVTIVQPPEPAAAATPTQPTNTAANAEPKSTERTVGVTTLTGAGHFASGSATLTPQAQQYFAAMAHQYTLEGQQESLRRELEAKKKANLLKQENVDAMRREWAEIKIALIGHTDDTGNDAGNALLSEQRARAVAEVFRGAGIPVDKLFYQGAGSSLPIADNRTDEGRARNRRVEVIELPPGADVAGYLALRRPNPAFFRPLPAATVATSAAEPKPAPPTTRAPTTAPPAAPAPAARRAPAPSAPAASDDWSEPAPAPKPKPAAAPPPRTAQTAAPRIDFGGSPATVRNDAILAAMGPPANSGSAWGFFISSAVADEDAIYGVPCTRDSEQRNQGLPVKQLSNNQPVYKTNEYLPGFNDTAWMGSVNGHGVGLNHVAILRDGNEPVRNPEVLVYKDFERKGAGKYDLSAKTQVKVYEGKQGLLYRVFVQNSYLRCIDVVVPVGGSLDATAGALYYDRDRTIYNASYVPSRVRSR